jgi:hypothetical protein
MEKQEYTALQVMILVRSQPGEDQEIKAFFDSVPFQYQLQDTLGDLIKQQLKEAKLNFNEVIISLDSPAEKAEKVQKKSSFVSRLFGGD